MGWAEVQRPAARGRECPCAARPLGKSIHRRGSRGRGGAGFTPPWELAARRLGWLGKWAKWSDWFPEPGSESTRAGRRWLWGTEPGQQRRRGHPRKALSATVLGDPAGWEQRGTAGGTSRWGKPSFQVRTGRRRQASPQSSGAQPPPGRSGCWPGVRRGAEEWRLASLSELGFDLGV